jgi:protein gp37
MAENTNIQWCEHTFNPTWGCSKISEGCEACYAKEWAERWGHEVWGPRAPRRTFGDAHWREPHKWNRQARAAGRPARVFCGSMCDVAEAHPTTQAQLPRLWETIMATRWLRWLLLSKRAGRLADMILARNTGSRFAQDFGHVWALVSVENKRWAEERLPLLASLKGTASVLGVSMEPLLEDVDLDPYLPFLDWVIVGGESTQGQHRARPFDLAWALRLRDQCQAAGVAFFMKQMGSCPVVMGRQVHLRHSHGGDPSEWPDELMLRQWPADQLPTGWAD